MGATGESVTPADRLRLSIRAGRPTAARSSSRRRARTADPMRRVSASARLRDVGRRDRGEARAGVGDCVVLQPNWSPGGHRIACWGERHGGQRDIWTFAADGSDAAERCAGDRRRGGRTGARMVAGRPRPLLLEPPRRHDEPLADRDRRAHGQGPRRFRAGHDAVDAGAASLSVLARRHAARVRQSRLSVDVLRAVLRRRARAIAGPPAPMLTGHARDPRPSSCRPTAQWIVFNEARGAGGSRSCAQDRRQPDRRLTDDAGRHRGPTWAPDGGRIAFYSDRGGAATTIDGPSGRTAAARDSVDPTARDAGCPFLGRWHRRPRQLIAVRTSDVVPRSTPRNDGARAPSCETPFDPTERGF